MVQGKTSVWEFIYDNYELFLTMCIIMGVNVVAMLLICPYACVRKCCRHCKKDHTRSDYRKAEKLRPAIFYLIFSTLLMALTIWSIYTMSFIFEMSRGTLCKGSIFMDTINMGKKEDPTWIGVQQLGR